MNDSEKRILDISLKEQEKIKNELAVAKAGADASKNIPDLANTHAKLVQTVVDLERRKKEMSTHIKSLDSDAEFDKIGWI